MMLITKEIAAKLPPIYSTEKVELDDKLVVLKLFGIGTAGAADYYIVEADLEDGTLWGFCCPMGWEMGEWGPVSLHELEALRWGSIPAIERDIHWTPVKFGEIRRKKDAQVEAANKPSTYVYEPTPYDLAKKEAEEARRPAEAPNTEQFSCDPNDPPGPIQVTRFEKALKDMRHEADMHREVTEYDGREVWSRCCTIHMGKVKTARQEYYDERQKLFDSCGGIVSKTNAAKLTKEAQAAAERIKAMQPVVDRREFREPAAVG